MSFNIRTFNERTVTISNESGNVCVT